MAAPGTLGAKQFGAVIIHDPLSTNAYTLDYTAVGKFINGPTPIRSTVNVTTTLPSGSNVASASTSIVNYEESGPNSLGNMKVRGTLLATPSAAYSLCYVTLALPQRTSNFAAKTDVWHNINGTDADLAQVNDTLIYANTSAATCTLQFNANSTKVHAIHFELAYPAA